MDQPGNQPCHSGHQAAADRMRELLARTVQDHVADDRITASAPDAIRRRLDGLERAVEQVRDLARSDPAGARADGSPAHPGQSLAGIAATLDGLAASLDSLAASTGAIDSRLASTDARVGALDNRSSGSTTSTTG